MTGTIYSFHRAEDHAILAIADPSNLQSVAAQVARAISNADGSQTRRAYVHNGRGIVAAGLCRAGIWNDTLRENYFAFDEAARAERHDAGYRNDKQTTPKQERKP